MQLRTNPKQHVFRGRPRLDKRELQALKDAEQKTRQKKLDEAKVNAKTQSQGTLDEEQTFDTWSNTRVRRPDNKRHFDRTSHSAQINNQSQRKCGYGKGGWGQLMDTLDDETYYREFYGRPHRTYGSRAHAPLHGSAPITLDQYFKLHGGEFTSANTGLANSSSVEPQQTRRRSRARRPSREKLVVCGGGRSPMTEDTEGRGADLPWIGGKQMPVEWFPAHPKKSAEPWHAGVLVQPSGESSLQTVDA